MDNTKPLVDGLTQYTMHMYQSFLYMGMSIGQAKAAVKAELDKQIAMVAGLEQSAPVQGQPLDENDLFKQRQGI